MSGLKIVVATALVGTTALAIIIVPLWLFDQHEKERRLESIQFCPPDKLKSVDVQDCVGSQFHMTCEPRTILRCEAE
jgi:hypothetical protein